MTVKLRIIPRLDIKGENVVKGIHLEGLRVMGKPQELAKKYYEHGADELLYMDIVASLYGRNIDFDLLKTVADKIFVPLAVGGGIRTIRDIDNALRAGADKVAINTAAIHDPILLREASNHFGSQCIILSVEAKKNGFSWEAYTDGGREHSGKDVMEWIRQGLDLGIGEILLMSIDREGTRKGFDVDLIQAVTSFATVPVIACGGAADVESILTLYTRAEPEAISLSSILHNESTTIKNIKNELSESKMNVRINRTF